VAAAAGKHSQLLPTPAERIAELNQRQRFVEFGLPQIDLGVVVARVAVENLQVTSHAAAVAKTLARQDSVENWQRRQWPSPESFRQGGVFCVASVRTRQIHREHRPAFLRRESYAANGGGPVFTLTALVFWGFRERRICRLLAELGSSLRPRPAAFDCFVESRCSIPFVFPRLRT